MNPNRPLSHWLALAFLVIAWGSSFALTKIAVQSVAPIWIPATRITVAAVILIIVMKARGGALPFDLTNWTWFFWLGLTGTMLPFFLISWASLHAPSSLVGILMATNPLMVLVLIHLFLPDEPVRPRHVAGFAVGFAGVVLLIGPGALVNLHGAGLLLWAEIAALGAALCYGVHNISARLSPDIDLIGKSAGTLAAMVPIAVGIAILAEPSGLLSATPEALLAILVLAVAPTGIATLVLFWLVNQAGARFLSMSNYLVPVFAALTGIAVMAEYLDFGDWTGLAMILTGILISEGRLGRTAATRRPSGD
ncbi:MAG TPA: DMT family transporter [Afifellaceae bacterium]|nr:DMT family transporter [Afifellaceae bacterium]